MNISYWEKEAFLSSGNVIIIGSGIVGILTAIYIREFKPDWKITVVDRASLPKGASTRNAGFVCFGSPTEILSDLKSHNADEVSALVQRRWRGIKLLREQLNDDQLHYNPCGGYELFLAEDSESLNLTIDSLPYLNKIMHRATSISDYFKFNQNQDSIHPTSKDQSYISIPQEAQIHPGFMIYNLIEKAKEKNIQFLWGWPVSKIEPASSGLKIIDNNGRELETEQVVVTTNGFSQLLFPELSVNCVRNQVILTEAQNKVDLRGCYHYNKGYVYFRNVGNRILLGGGRDKDLKGETTSNFGLNEKIQNYLHEFLYQYIVPSREIKIEYTWSGILGVGEQKYPIINEQESGLWLAVRMGGMGIAIGAAVAKEVAEKLTDQPS